MHRSGSAADHQGSKTETSVGIALILVAFSVSATVCSGIVSLAVIP